MARWLSAALGFGIVAALAACAAPPPPPPPTVVDLTLSATAAVNPAPDGTGAPVVLRVYQLAGTANFTGAEFFDLFNNDQTTLKTDLVKREDLTLAPGQSKTLTIQPTTDQTKAIGVFAAYRDYAGAVWHVTAEVPAHKTTKITVIAGKAGLAIKPASPAPAGSSGS